MGTRGRLVQKMVSWNEDRDNGEHDSHTAMIVGQYESDVCKFPGGPLQLHYI